ncbi:peptidase C19 family protein [Heterostelium album PN500]|uniref:ubiquitinyl hydrolase 1 n=1 Tax=Heterostelium pallidum (strain ATCC 26659 / Pp 5 / PN500) TaxID=670386 RepID=D3BSN8_HETP5|nr:peptidase C19 family protein [Heterostelium album PN500]EFA75503.1 peptidase C19 family protein [Heterostelium album PN500]|eukprot:XP_020427637.1 peptidase C19 family protein [Heterostelium album PN500]
MPISLVDSTVSTIANGLVGTVQKVLKRGAANTMSVNLNNGTNKFKRLSKPTLPVKQKIQSIKQQLANGNSSSSSSKQTTTNDKDGEDNNVDHKDTVIDHDQDTPPKKSENLKRFESDMESSGKVLLHRVIKFRESAKPLEDPNTLLKRKYKPINKLVTTTTTTTSTTLIKKQQQQQQKEEILDDNILHPPKKILFPADRIDAMMLWKTIRKVGSGLNNIGSLNPRESMTTVIGSIFGGYLQSQVKCSVCSYESNTFDPFMDLSVDINQADSLSKALQRFVKAEQLDGSNKYKCCKCKKLVKASKRMTIHVAPPVLTVQLKRFSFLGFHGGKISKPVQFDPVLNLTPYMTTSTNDVVYDLYGVLVHAGSSTNSGHYYCYTKSSSGVWHGLNDESVSQPVVASPNVQIESLALTSNSKKRKILDSDEQQQQQQTTQSQSTITEKKKKIDNESNQTTTTTTSSSSLMVRQWDDKSIDETKQKIIEEQNNIASKTGQQLKQASRDKDSQFDFKIAKWDNVDDETLKAQKELMKDESLKELVHKKDEWDEEFDKGRTRKLKKKKNINFAENQFNSLSSILQKKKEDQLKYGDQTQTQQSNGRKFGRTTTNTKNNNIRTTNNNRGNNNKPNNFKRKQQQPAGKGKFNRK